MNELIKGAQEALAAALGAIGIIGSPRRRTGIHQDLELLRDLEQSPEFGRGTMAHQALVKRIESEVEVYTRLVRRKIEWGAVAFAAIIGGGFGYLTYVLNESGFRWYSIPVGFVAAIMLIAILGMLTNKDERASDKAAPVA